MSIAAQVSSIISGIRIMTPSVEVLSATGEANNIWIQERRQHPLRSDFEKVMTKGKYPASKGNILVKYLTSNHLNNTVRGKKVYLLNKKLCDLFYRSIY